MHARGVDEFGEQHAALNKGDRRAVAQRHIGQVIGGGDTVGGGHVLHDDPGGAGNMLANMARDDPPEQIIATARWRANHKADLLARIEVRRHGG